MDRRQVLSAFAAGVVAAPITSAVGVASTPDREKINWVTRVLESMNTIKPGMTRSDLRRVFTIEGGISTRLERTFVSQQCPYFKVDVTFRAVGQPEKDRDGRVALTEDPCDEILSISRPYLAFGVMD